MDWYCRGTMIATTKAFQTEDGSTFANLEDAQRHGIEGLIDIPGEASKEQIAEIIINNKDAIIAIFSSGKAGRPRKARKAKKQVEQPAE